MKFITNFLVLIFGLLLATTANAESPREELKQMVEQLQKSPNDDALREKIIKLALTVNPSPALPTEAERRMTRGDVAFKGATSVADYQTAAKEFEQATLAAPWYGDAYFNLGVAQDKAEDYDAALRSLKLAALASPGSKDAEKLSYAVEFRKEKAATANAAVAAEKARRIADGTLIVPGKGIGPVRLGMSEAEVIAVMGSTPERSTGDPDSVWLDWRDGTTPYPNGKDSMLNAGFWKGRVVSVSTNKHGTRYTTSDNLSVGSSMSDVKAAMGQEDSVRRGSDWQRLCYAQGILFYFDERSIVTSIEVREINWCVK